MLAVFLATRRINQSCACLGLGIRAEETAKTFSHHSVIRRSKSYLLQPAYRPTCQLLNFHKEIL